MNTHLRTARATPAADFLCEGCAAWLAEGSPTIQEWGDGFAQIIEVKPNAPTPAQPDNQNQPSKTEK